jgi:hypothetical protein
MVGMMLETAPDVVNRFIDAAARRDYDAIGECFTEEATVHDEGGTHHGRGEIRQWQRDTHDRYDYTVTIVGGELVGVSEYHANAHLEGNFPGHEADVEYRFTIFDGHIRDLRIE